VVSGGQTGVDRAALDAARARSIACGGWCPRGRTAEDGAVPDRYPLLETPSADPAQRTEWNVRDADATLVLTRGEPAGGTAWTLRCAERWGRAHRLVRLDREADVLGATRAWLARHTPAVLNVAGPRESECPGIGAEARALLERLFDEAEA
jgi:hypothetical protein